VKPAVAPVILLKDGGIYIGIVTAARRNFRKTAFEPALRREHELAVMNRLSESDLITAP
jgi:hypothetical protein